MTALLLDREFNHSRKLLEVLIREKIRLVKYIWRRQYFSPFQLQVYTGWTPMGVQQGTASVPAATLSKGGLTCVNASASTTVGESSSRTTPH